ncbi:MAG TPA: DMT family transporter, partial [Steroidobacter sp.]|nr:DMT family transporter [Steroidobacter sp.]
MNAPAASERRELITGVLLAGAGAIAFSCKAIIIKLAYRYGVDAVTTIMYRMLFALPLFLTLSWWAGRNRPAPSAQDWRTLFGLGFCGYYLASYLDFAGLQYISASLERLILYLNPTIVLLAGKLLFKTPVSRAQWLALGLSYIGVLVVFGHDVRSGPDIGLGTLLVFGSAVSYALYLVQRPDRAPPGRDARHRAGHEHCLLPVYRTVFYLETTLGDAGCTRGALAVSAECGVVHLRAGAHH